MYAELRAAVFDGGFGARERLSDVRLAARFGVSRTPVREALARLLADGPIERGGAPSRRCPPPPCGRTHRTPLAPAGRTPPTASDPIRRTGPSARSSAG
ncbi:GntR family transcriptional regulator [Streptomyces sp. NPDC058625]|uniref:GntR family transcriptional regulator n=1 Tax=Streptomyces sp. NPDC058625 TaxID=3346564 RepID=UPI0036491D73